MTTTPTPPLTEEVIQRFRQVFEEKVKRIYQERLDELFFGDYAPHLQHQTSNLNNPPATPCKIQNPKSKIQN